MYKFRCHSCNTKIGVQDEYAGMRVRCPKCGTPIKVQEYNLASVKSKKRISRAASERTQYSVFLCKGDAPSESQPKESSEAPQVPLFYSDQHQQTAASYVSPRVIILSAVLFIIAFIYFIYSITS